MFELSVFLWFVVLIISVIGGIIVGDKYHAILRSNRKLVLRTVGRVGVHRKLY